MPDREYYIWDKEGEEYEDWMKFYYFSESYRKAFLTLLYKEETDQRGTYHEEEILPVLMLFSQYLELAFKTLLMKANIPINSIITHNPKQIYEKVKENYPDFVLSENSLLFIEDFYWMNEFGQSLRYPVSSRGQRFWLHPTNGRCFLLSGISAISKETMEYILNYFRTKVFH